MACDPMNTWCHHTGMTKTCAAVRTKRHCFKWVSLNGVDRNTGAQIAEWGCVDSFLPQLTLETNALLRGLQSAVETRGDAQEQQQARAAQALERIAAAPPIPLDSVPLLTDR